jgi:ATP-dependent RNA helicase DHR2
MPDRVRTVFTDNSENIVKTSREPTGAHSNSNSRGKKRKRSDDLSAKNNAEQSKDAPSIPGDGSTENPTKSKARHESPKFIVKDMSSAPKSKSSYSSLKQKSEALLRFRKELPIWSSAHLIRSSLRGPRDVLILAGETGSGKSTQVPQFLMTEPWCKNCIAITQPRRVAAISLARRVAEEIGTPLGSSSPASKVGYAVRFDKSHSPSTKIKFLTEGMLLQEMFLDPALRKYSAVIVDEVHERSVNVDLILGFLRKLVTEKKRRGGKPLKVVVMSATADVASLIDFFTAGYEKDVAQQEVSLGDIRMDSLPTQERALPESNDIIRNLLNKSKHVASCFISGRQFHVDVTYLSAPTQDFIESALKCAFEIHYKQPLPGDILVFLTGQDAIETLERLINEYADAMGPEVPKVCPPWTNF